MNEGLRGPGCGHERGRNGADGDGPWFSKAPYKLAKMKLARRCRQSQDSRGSNGWLKVPCCQDLTRHILVREGFLSAERGCEGTEKMRKMGLAGEKLNSAGAKSASDKGRGGRNTQLESWTKRRDSQGSNQLGKRSCQRDSLVSQPVRGRKKVDGIDKINVLAFVVSPGQPKLKGGGR
jgi:hypothetical protein